jgi:glutamyl/glutaminyl-tRNA synthetase
MPPSGALVTRFAPAPTGYLHLGHVRNAAHVWGLARAHGGRVRLRIEDHDTTRCRPEYERAIREDLAWLGFEPDDEVPRQSTRGAIYRELLEPFVERGLVYGCACTRQQIAAAPNPGSAELWYPGTCRERHLGLDDGLGWRVRMDPGLERFEDGWLGPQVHDPSRQCGDVLVRDRVGQWTYQWAVVVDDFLQDITDVVRGRDLLESTGRQIRLGRLAGRAEPARFFHHALVMKSPTQKLSKADRDRSVAELRAAGWTPARVLAAARTA